MRLLFLAVAAVVLGVLVDRAMLAAEARGWIYWRRRKPSSGSLSAAALAPLHLLTQPSYEHVVTARDHDRIAPVTQERADPPDPGTPA